LSLDRTGKIHTGQLTVLIDAPSKTQKTIDFPTIPVLIALKYLLPRSQARGAILYRGLYD
jgi:hypothetical protein